MKYFDANTMIGANFSPREGKFFGVEDLLNELDFYGINEALVYHGLARDYDLRIGNETLIKTLAHEPRLHSCWIIGMHQCRTCWSPQKLIAKALACKVKVFRLHFGGPLSDLPQIDILCYQELFQELAAHHFPVIIEFEGNVSIGGQDVMHLDPVLEQFPAIPIILSGLRITGQELKAIYPRLEKFRQLHVMTSFLHLAGVIEDIVDKFGYERLISGSNYPYFNSGTTKISLAYADISDDARQHIAWNNIRQLMYRVK